MASLKPDKSKKSGCRTFIVIQQLMVAFSLFLPLPAQALETVTLQLKWPFMLITAVISTECTEKHGKLDA